MKKLENKRTFGIKKRKKPSNRNYDKEALSLAQNLKGGY